MRRISTIAITLTIMATSAYAQSKDADGCVKREAAMRDSPAPGTRIDLALCYQHAGKLVRAWAVFREAVDLANEAGDPERSDQAQRSAAALEPHLARLTIVMPTALPAGFTVTWDSRPVAGDSLGVALYAGAGQHELAVSAPGFKRVKRVTTLAGGKVKHLVIPALAAALGPDSDGALAVDNAPADLVVAPPIPVEPSLSWLRSHLVLEMGGMGLATAATGLVFLAQARDSLNQARELCGATLACNTIANQGRAEQLVRDARSRANTATGFAVATGAMLAADAMMYLTGVGQRAASSLAPIINEAGAGVSFSGRF